MADGLSPAKAVLLAVQLTSTADIPSLRYLVASHSKTFRRGSLILRILLTFLPETLDASSYLPLLDDFTSRTAQAPPKPSIFPSLDQDISEQDASKRVRKLHLLHLAPSAVPTELDLDPLTQFLIHRAYKVDSGAGLLPQVLALIIPFINHSEYLRTWTIVTLLPLLRFSYNYYPEEICLRSLQSMSSLDNTDGVRFLLSKAEKDGKRGYEFVGRDLKGLIGPWMYGDSQTKRGKGISAQDMAARTILPLEDFRSISMKDSKWPGWDEVFRWVVAQANSSWPLAVDAIEQWDGPGDVDLGGYEGGTVWLEEEDQRILEIRYARAALATAYSIKEDSVEAQTGIHRILTRIISLLDFERIPTLPAAASLLPSIALVSEGDILCPENGRYLRSFLLEGRNILTNPKEQAISLLYALTVSSYLLTRAGCSCSVRKAGELALLQIEREQKSELQRYMNAVNQTSKNDDKYWIRIRNELLWLRDWASESILPSETENSLPEYGNGIFGRIGKEYLEAEMLKALLSNARFSLARSIYEMSPEKPLPKETVERVVISTSKATFDNAGSGTKMREAVKKSADMLKAFPQTLWNSRAKDRQQSLIQLWFKLSEYGVEIKNRQPLSPIDLKTHREPYALIGTLLDKRDKKDKQYTNLNEMRELGTLVVLAGLAVPDLKGHFLAPEQEEEQKILMERRITSMCVDAALADDDFETAYSYVMNHLITSGSQLLDENDDWSWRAALQAGKYHRNANTTKPTHIGNAYANPEIRHLEKRMECLSQALNLAPKSTLVDILGVFRRCEEALTTQIRLEEEAEAAHDEQADQHTGLSGSRHAGPPKEQASEETPMSLFELGRRSAEDAKRSLAALRASQARNERLTRESSSSAATGVSAANNGSLETPEQVAASNGVKADTVRKRDQLRNAAVGTLATGIGWLINAPPVTQAKEQDEDED